MKLGWYSDRSQSLLDSLSPAHRDQATAEVFGKVLTSVRGLGTISMVGLFPVLGWLVGRSLGTAGWVMVRRLEV